MCFSEVGCCPVACRGNPNGVIHATSAAISKINRRRVTNHLIIAQQNRFGTRNSQLVHWLLLSKQAKYWLLVSANPASRIER